jgi:erythromycin esterase
MQACSPETWYQIMKKIKYVILCTIMAVVFSGCSEKIAVKDIKNYVSQVNTIQVNSDVKIVGLGEATHGNIEYQELKKEVFQALVQNNDCKVFAIEGDFGGCRKVNDYIHTGEGTSEEAVNEIGFGIYRTEEMKELVQWMYEYNQTAEEADELSFYGFDMQRYDNNKAGVFAYLTKVDAQLATQYETSLIDLNDDTVYTQKKSVVAHALKQVEILMSTMEANKAEYINTSSEKEYNLAYEYATCIKENATLRGTSASYSNTRDQYMADKVAWIYEYVGDNCIFINGHNGHINKVSAANGYTSMGQHLADTYGAEYYAIGTDFYKTTAEVVSSSGAISNVSLTNNNSLVNQFINLDSNINFMDFASVQENEELNKIVNSSQKMGNVGAEFSGWQKYIKVMYTLKMVPAKAYDGVIVVKEATPTIRYEIEK